MAFDRKPTVDGVPVEEFLRTKRGSLAVKRAFDVVASGLGLLVLSPLFLFLALRIRRDGDGPVLFRQERMGRATEPFTIYKFRTMIPDAEARGRQITVGEDPRITKTGAWLRRTKLDELPQLYNVFRGDMSLVGPRPEVPRYLPHYTDEDLATLWIRPGITAASSVEYVDESAVLAASDNPDETYIHDILPKKNAMNRLYLRTFSLWKDIGIIWKTVFSINQ